MTIRDRVLALVVALCWGVNFPATHLALEHFPPFLLVAVRFAIIAIPTVLFVPRPKVKWRWLLGYGAGFGVAQFAFLYLAMANGMPSGLASLVLQCSAPFTVLLGATLLKERLSRQQLIGIGIAVAGLAAIALVRAQSAAVLPVALTVLGGLGWAFGNLASRQAHADRPFALVLWMAVVPPIPMLALSLLIEGPARDAHAFATLGERSAIWPLVGLAYVVVVGTLIGSGLWTSLLAKYPSSRVAPFSLAVPVFGFTSSWLVLGEHLDPVEIGLGVIVIGGVLYGLRKSGRKRPPETTEETASAGVGHRHDVEHPVELVLGDRP